MVRKTALTAESSESIPLREVARYLPVDGDRSVSHSTLLNWIKNGVNSATGNRVKLAATKVGGRYYTTLDGVRAFLDALNGTTSE